MSWIERSGRALLGIAALIVGSSAPIAALAQDREAPQDRPIRIRWTAVKKVNTLDRSFIIQRATGRDGEKATSVDTVIVTGKATKFVIPPREGQAPPPPGTFANVVIGARVTIMGTLSPDGKIHATQVMVSAPRGGNEGGRPAEKDEP